VDLRGHVRGGAELSGKESTAISTFGWRSESKISNLQVEFWVKHDILWLQIPVAGPGIMHVVKRSHQLREVEPRYVLSEFAWHGNKVKQLAALDKL